MSAWPEYLIQGPQRFGPDRDKTPVIHIETNDDYTPAQAVEFALKIIDTARPDVRITNRSHRPLKRVTQP
jgi:hypothetical protein